MTNVRSQQRVEIQPETPKGMFKASCLRTSILRKPSKLPEVERRERTEFKEFSLSKTNRVQIELPESPKFKARKLNRRIFDSPSVERSGRRSIQPMDIKLATEERASIRRRVSIIEEPVAFKAREMPNFETRASLGASVSEKHLT